MTPLIDRKVDLFHQAIQDLAAVEEDGKVLLDFLPKAKILLDGGAWWKRASAWTDKKLGAALMDWFVSEEAFVEILEDWKSSMLAGCRRGPGSRRGNWAGWPGRSRRPPRRR